MECFESLEFMACLSPSPSVYTSWSDGHEGGVCEVYDVFISYRWNENDSDFTEKLFDRLKMPSTNGQQEVVTFRDKQRLYVTDTYRKEFIKALLSSSVAVPIISHDALERMTQHDSNKVDNVLLEWLCIVIIKKMENKNGIKEILKRKNVRLTSVIPICFGRRSKKDYSIQDFFVKDYETKEVSLRTSTKQTERTVKKSIMDLIPDIIPEATIACAKELFEDVSHICIIVGTNICIYMCLHIYVYGCMHLYV